ncbi:MAG TPA: discoidin domain-containing protein [Pirellulaceae bacterium]|nr:discoidin domain-containing protein [Pirellulaceae bacterium]
MKCFIQLFYVKLAGLAAALVMSFSLVGCYDLHGQVVPINNAGFEAGQLAIHGAPVIPQGWQSALEGAVEQRLLTAWDAPAKPAIAIHGGASLSQVIAVPALDKELKQESQWHLVLAVDVIGVADDSLGDGELQISLHNAESQQRLAEMRCLVKQRAPKSQVARPRVFASSFQPGSQPENVFDGNPETVWHSKWGDTNHPHWLAIDLGEERELRGLTYLPRSDMGNGTIKDYRLEVTTDGIDWLTVARGAFEYRGNDRRQEVVLDQPVRCRGIRLWADSKRFGAADINASCAELVLDVIGGFELLPSSQVELPTAPQREFLIIDQRQLTDLSNLEISLLSLRPQAVVIDRVHLFYIPQNATHKMAGKANGVSGPDVLGAGSYGFRGLMIHNYPALPVIDVADGKPSGQAGLVGGDLIVGINDRFLPTGNVEPGFAWLANSHEALLGQAAIEAFGSGQRLPLGRVRLNVLRQGAIANIDVRLNLPKEIGEPDFLVNPRSLELLNQQLMQHVIQHQHADGHWPGSSIHTALGGLALLSTGDRRHAEQIKAAANWLCSNHSEPDTGFYWYPSFAGIFLAEYYLATGDQRVLPVIERLLRHMAAALHTSKWGTDTFGHGPRALPYENKSLVAVIVHCLVFEKLAKRCGIESNLHELLHDFIESAWSDPSQGGHGALGYNASFKDLDEFWSRTGLLLLALKLDDQRPEMRTAMAEIMYQRHPWFRNSHAYGEPGGALGLIGLSQENPEYFREVFSQYRWWFGVAWEPGYGLHYTPPHMGAPYMEGPVLFNNAYAIVTNLHKQTLHITGSTKTRWLNVNRIPVPLSEVLILQDKAGLVSLRCKIPGPEIRYTVDGSDPGPRSSVYRQPFAVAEGSMVKAVAVDENSHSPLATRRFALNKSKWKVVAASGNRDVDKARERAAGAVDGDPLVAWVTDAGESALGYPHEIEIDLGEERTIQAVSVRYLFQGAAAKRIVVSGARDAQSPLEKLAEVNLDAYRENPIIEFQQKIQVQRLRLQFADPFEDGPLLMIGEIDAL